MTGAHSEATIEAKRSVARQESWLNADTVRRSWAQPRPRFPHDLSMSPFEGSKRSRRVIYGVRELAFSSSAQGSDT